MTANGPAPVSETSFLYDVLCPFFALFHVVLIRSSQDSLDIFHFMRNCCFFPYNWKSSFGSTALRLHTPKASPGPILDMLISRRYNVFRQVSPTNGLAQNRFWLLNGSPKRGHRRLKLMHSTAEIPRRMFFVGTSNSMSYTQLILDLLVRRASGVLSLLAGCPLLGGR